jgi:hypothetical protein
MKQPETERGFDGRNDGGMACGFYFGWGSWRPAAEIEQPVTGGAGPTRCGARSRRRLAKPAGLLLFFRFFATFDLYIYCHFKGNCDEVRFIVI